MRLEEHTVVFGLSGGIACYKACEAVRLLAGRNARVQAVMTAGAQQFVGEDAIDHTPRDEKVEIVLGEAFDVVAERRQLSLRQPSRCVIESDWQTVLRNHKDVAVTVEVVEQASMEWGVSESSHPLEQRSATSFAFRVPVPAGGTSQLSYRYRQRNCRE